MDKIEKWLDNPAKYIDPEEMYVVTYTIDQSGKRHEGLQLIKGADMTEKQCLDELWRRQMARLTGG